MTVLTGSDGSLSYEGITLGKAKNWQLSRSRERLTNSKLNEWDETWVPGRRQGTANTTIFYDPTDVNTSALLNNILINKPPKSLLGLNLRSGTDTYDVPVYVEQVGPTIAVGNASAVDVNFRLAAPGLALRIVGPTRVLEDETRSFKAEIIGAQGAWAYLWESLDDPIIATPNLQTTNITFPSTGTARIKVTATLGSLVLTDFLDVVVDAYPLVWSQYLYDTIDIYPAGGLGFIYPVHCTTVDKFGNIFNLLFFGVPGISVSHGLLTKFAKSGAVLWNKRITFPADPIMGLQTAALTPAEDGGCFMIIGNQISGNYNHLTLLRATTSGAIGWAKRIFPASGTEFGNILVIAFHFVEAHNALYVASNAYSGNVPAFMAINATTGAVVTFQYYSFQITQWAYNPLNNTIVGCGEVDTSNFRIIEGPAFFKDPTLTTFIATQYNYTNYPAGNSYESGGSLAINSSGEIIVTSNTGFLKLDATFNPSVNITTTSGSGQSIFSYGGFFDTDGSYVSAFRDTVSNIVTDRHAGDLTSRLSRTTNRLAVNYQIPSTRPGSQQSMLSKELGGLVLPNKRGFSFNRITMPSGTTELFTKPGDVTNDFKVSSTGGTGGSVTATGTIQTRSTVSLSDVSRGTNVADWAITLTDETYATDWRYTAVTV